MEFQEKLVNILNYGALNLAMGMGYSLGLFETLDRLNRPATADEIAEKSGLSERYVREWLGIMACGEIVHIADDAAHEPRFVLPEEHGDLLTRRAKHMNLGVYTQEIPILTQTAMADVMKGFHTGEGVSYDNYLKFQGFMAELADAKHRRVLVDQFLPSVDKGKMVEKLKSGIHVCDLGCGTGVAAMVMAEAFPDSGFTGLDCSSYALDKAKEIAGVKGLDNLEFILADAASFQKMKAFHERFDYITAFDAIHDQTRPGETLKNICAMLKPGGAFSMVDIAASSAISGNLDHPMGPFLYTVSLMHCMPVGLADKGAGLGMMWGREKAEEMLKAAGFEEICVEAIPEDSFNLHYFCKKSGY